MRSFRSHLAILFVSAVAQHAFGQVSNPLPRPTPGQLPNFQKILDDARIGAVPPGDRDARRARRDSAEARRQAKKNMEPDGAVADEFSELLDSLDARMIRLHPDFGCESKLTLSVDANCSGRVIGASRFEGLHYDKGNLVGDSYFTIFMIADIGEVDFEDVDKQNEKVKVISNIVPPTEFAAARTMYGRLRGAGSPSMACMLAIVSRRK